MKKLILKTIGATCIAGRKTCNLVGDAALTVAEKSYRSANYFESRRDTVNDKIVALVAEDEQRRTSKFLEKTLADTAETEKEFVAQKIKKAKLHRSHSKQVLPADTALA